MSKITKQQLKSYLWESANILRGKIDSGDFKHYILGLLFYKRLRLKTLKQDGEAALLIIV